MSVPSGDKLNKYPVDLFLKNLQKWHTSLNSISERFSEKVPLIVAKVGCVALC